jgi:hypothetical protein
VSPNAHSTLPAPEGALSASSRPRTVGGAAIAPRSAVASIASDRGTGSPLATVNVRGGETAESPSPS